MGGDRPEMRIKGLSLERMERLKRFTKLLNAELALVGGEPVDVLEAHEAYQGLIDDHEGTWRDLARKLAAERTTVSYVEGGEESEESLDEFEGEEDQEG
jgi:hypothetical protein